MKHYIDSQINYNRGKNLFYRKNILGFAPETVACAGELGGADNKELLISYTVQKVLQEFCRVNQYMSFSEQDKALLSNLYSVLLDEIKERKESLQTLSEKHYQHVRDWLKNSNPFAEELYSNQGTHLEAVCCSEYNAEFQIKVLHIDLALLSEPVLDIGCGEQGSLVHYLREKGFEAYGIDRFSENSDILCNADWLEYDYGKNRWGTIISNLGFSNHFCHNHLRKDGDYVSYAKKYMDILRSLKPGGSFHYAPALPFIEQFLDDNEYQISSFDIESIEYKATVVKRIR